MTISRRRGRSDEGVQLQYIEEQMTKATKIAPS